MIRHLVMFTLTGVDEAAQQRDLDGMREQLAALVGVIPGLQKVTVERDLGLVPGHKDIVLISDHDDNAALEGYQAHPGHLAAAEYIRSITTSDRTTVDYEL